MANYYEILEVNEKASVEVIDKAYRVLAKKYHPDVFQGDKAEAEKMMKQLNEAYDVLSDETRRSNYDAVLLRKKQLEQAKTNASVYSSTSNSQSQEQPTLRKRPISNNVRPQENNDTPITNPSKYNKDKFIIDTTYMSDKQKKKIEKKLQERYIEAYDNYLRERGYKLKYKWTPKRILTAIAIVVITILIFALLFCIPPINDYFTSLYNDNILIRFVVLTIQTLISAVWATIKTVVSMIF